MPKYTYSHADGDYVSLNDVSSPEQEASDRRAHEASLAGLGDDFAPTGLPYPGLPLGYFPQPERRAHDYGMPF